MNIAAAAAAAAAECTRGEARAALEDFLAAVVVLGALFMIASGLVNGLDGMRGVRRVGGDASSIKKHS